MTDCLAAAEKRVPIAGHVVANRLTGGDTDGHRPRE